MALRGDEVYADLESSYGRARDQLDRAGQDLQRATAELEQLRADEARELSRLAVVRLGELEAHRITKGLDGADRKALDLLERKRAAVAELAGEIAASEQHQRELASEREHRRQERDEALAAHEDLVKATFAQVSATEEHEFQRARAEGAAGQAARAEQKAQQAEADRQEKGRSYEQDKLFSYLWRRRYRFPEYRANKLIRTLDDWVADLCKYERFHRDYAMLLEIPKRLRAHADRLAAVARAEAEALAKIEQHAQEEAGVPALQERLTAREQELAAAEAQIADEEHRYADLLARRSRYEAGDDETTTEALRTIGAQLEWEDVATLRSDAARTGTPEDDALVATIERLRARSHELQDQLDPLRQRQAEALQALRNIEDLRRRFRRNNYDAADSVFDSSLDLGDLLSGLLRGALATGQVWHHIGRHQRFRRSSPTSSSTALNVLGSILSSSSHSHGGFGGGGGFSTGGGFGGGGGGGFSTGGGF